MSARYLREDPTHPGLDDGTVAIVARYMATQPVIHRDEAVGISPRGDVAVSRTRYLSDGTFVWSDHGIRALIRGAVPEEEFLRHIASAGAGASRPDTPELVSVIARDPDDFSRRVF